MTEASAGGRPRAAEHAGPGSMWGVALLACALVLAGVYFWDGLDALLLAWQTAEYSHGPIIPVLSGLLFLRQLKDHPPEAGPVTDRWQGVVVIAGALLLGLLGKITRIPDLVAYATIVFIGGLVLTSFGWRRGRHFWPGVLHLVFMLPLPGLLYWKISTTLQFISSEFGVYLIRLMDIPVFLDGNIIDLGEYKLHVAEACSGLRYLFPIMSFSYVFATLYRGPVWHKAILLLSAAPITVVMNSVRIGLIGVIVNSYGIEHVEGLTHLLEGWVIFITCVLVLFGLARLMLALQPTPMTLSEALDLDFTGFSEQFARLRLTRVSAGLGVAVGLLLAANLAWIAAPPRPEPTISRQPLAAFPGILDDWTLQRTQSLEPEVERVLAADDYYSATFTRGADGAVADFFVAWYRDQTRGGIHSPEVCLPGGGWEMAEILHVDIGPKLGLGESFPINRAIIQKGEDRLFVFYWFEQYGGRTSSDVRAKLALLRDSTLYGRTDGALVRLITPMARGESAAEAERRLLDLTKPIIAALPDFVPRR